MGNYASVADVHAEGVPAAVDDAKIERRIVKWEAIVEKVTKNIFRVLTPGELVFDGTDSHRMHFGIPLVAVTEMKINGETTAIPTTEFRAFTGKAQPQDDRKNPKIELRPNDPSSIFSSSRFVFRKGLDQLITATWGYVDELTPTVFTTPTAIRDSVVQLVIFDLDDYFDRFRDYSGPALAPKQRERTDDHEIEWADITVDITWGMIPQEIRDVLALFRAPIKVSIPKRGPNLFGAPRFFEPTL